MYVLFLHDILGFSVSNISDNVRLLYWGWFWNVYMLKK